jgi:hypothetical protein
MTENAPQAQELSEKWQRLSSDTGFRTPAVPVGPGNVPTGGDLSLDIGWERFEKLLVDICSSPLALEGIQFRRYGTPGQAQHGIDLAGSSHGQWTVVQCKHVVALTAAQLRAAVALFADGRRPFDAKRFIVAVRHETRTTQLEDELADLKNEHTDLEIELWGAEQLNQLLRYRKDIVTRFWTAETADTFCYPAAPTGVAAADPEWRRLAEQVSLTPLGEPSTDVRLRQASQLEVSDPGAAAQVYDELAQTVTEEGFAGHALILRRRQLTALAAAGRHVEAAAVSAVLAAKALHNGDFHNASLLQHQLDELARAVPPDSEEQAAIRQHVRLIQAAVNAVDHPLGETTRLQEALIAAGEEPATRATLEYEPLLTLMLVELTLSDTLLRPPASAADSSGQHDAAMAGAAALEPLVAAALQQLERVPTVAGDELAFRLTLARACYDDDVRTSLLTEARSLRLPRTRAAIVLAAQGRRDMLAGLPDEAREKYQVAVNAAIENGQTELARGWLYAIRNINVQFGPLTEHLDEPHHLASALPVSTAPHVLNRTRDLEVVARRASMDGKANAAIKAARRWLADSVVIGDVADEAAAAELLGDCYADNSAPDHAACAYQLAGEGEKLEKLATACADHVLPAVSPGIGAVWQQLATHRLLRAQDDLLPDDVAAAVLDAALQQREAARTGELVDNVFGELAVSAAKTACILAARGTAEQAQQLLNAMSDSVERAENHYFRYDNEHVTACLRIIETHGELVSPAARRIFDLAEQRTPDALHAINGDAILDLLRPEEAEHVSHAARLPDAERAALVARLQVLADAGAYDAAIACARLGSMTQTVTTAAETAERRILERPAPDGMTFSFGTRMGQDAYLTTFLTAERRRACLAKLQTIAEDRREAAANRHDAVNAATLIASELPEDDKRVFHLWTRQFVSGEQDGSMLDDQVTNPHPLSSFKVSIGESTFVGVGIESAGYSAQSTEERNWVKEQAAALLSHPLKTVVSKAAVVLSRLGEVSDSIDPRFLTSHPSETVRQLAAFLATSGETLDATLLNQVARDPSPRVRRLLAQRLRSRTASAASGGATADGTAEALATLRADPRYSVRAILPDGDGNVVNS